MITRKTDNLASLELSHAYGYVSLSPEAERVRSNEYMCASDLHKSDC